MFLAIRKKNKKKNRKYHLSKQLDNELATIYLSFPTNVSYILANYLSEKESTTLSLKVLGRGALPSILHLPLKHNSTPHLPPA